jgi:hypothetical protein
VSHWSVGSNAATRLTTSTFEKLKADPTIGRAEAESKTRTRGLPGKPLASIFRLHSQNGSDSMVFAWSPITASMPFSDLKGV